MVAQPRKPGRPPERYCRHGHDTWEVGRTRSRVCRACERDRARRRRHCDRGHDTAVVGRDPNTRACLACLAARSDVVPAAPLQSLLAMRSTRELAAAYAERYRCREESALRALHRLRATTMVAITTADRWCTVLGLHLSELWPEIYRG